MLRQKLQSKLFIIVLHEFFCPKKRFQFYLFDNENVLYLSFSGQL